MRKKTFFYIFVCGVIFGGCTKQYNAVYEPDQVLHHVGNGQQNDVSHEYNEMNLMAKHTFDTLDDLKSVSSSKNMTEDERFKTLVRAYKKSKE